MSGLQTREWESYKPGLITSTDPNSHLLTRSFAELAQSVRSVTIRSVFGSHAAVPTPEAPRESLVVCLASSGLGLVQVYILISSGRSGRCLRSCTNRRNLVAPLAGYELKRPYICRLTMGGLKTREWESYNRG